MCRQSFHYSYYELPFPFLLWTYIALSSPSCVITNVLFISPTLITVAVIGIALGVSVTAFGLFVVVPIELCIIIGGVCSSRRSHTHTTVITKPPPPTTTATAVTATAGYQPYPAQGYPPQHYSAAGTDTKTAPPPPYIAHPIRCLPTLPSNLRLNMIIPELSSHV